MVPLAEKLKGWLLKPFAGDNRPSRRKPRPYFENSKPPLSHARPSPQTGLAAAADPHEFLQAKTGPDGIG
jgi:hypothetical protein